MSENSSFYGTHVAVFSSLGKLGDATTQLHLAWIFHRAGAQVSFFSDLFFSARNYFPWMEILPCKNRDIAALPAQFDLVFCDLGWMSEMPRCDNVAYILPLLDKFPDFGNRTLVVRGHTSTYPGADRPFCLDSRAGLSMVQWVGRYVRDVFNLSCQEPIHVEKMALPSPPPPPPRIAFFPIPGFKNDYSPHGWRWLEKRLVKDGWAVDFICHPSEQEKVHKIFEGSSIRGFLDIKGLMDYLSGCAAAVACDSGGGHLASLMGIKSFTLTRRGKDFVWRPGFQGENHVLTPVIRLKLMGRYIWRPFIPIWRIPENLGQCPEPFLK